MMSENFNWGRHSRGYLPHYDSAGLYQMITYRLADSLPAEVVQELAEKWGIVLNLAEQPEGALPTSEKESSAEIRKHRFIEKYLE